MWQLPHMWPESHLLFPLFPGTQQGELPLQLPAPFCTPHRSDLTTSLGPEVAPAFWCQAQRYPVSSSVASTLLNLPEPREGGRCYIFTGEYLILVLFSSQTVPLSSGHCFVFKTPQKIGSSIGNRRENHSKSLLWVFSSWGIYYSIWVFVCAWEWGAGYFPAGKLWTH